MSSPEPLITPPPALGPPIIGTDTPGSAPGIDQPVFMSGTALVPTAASWFPQAPAGTWMPPPEVGMGGNAPFDTPVVPPGTGTGIPQPQYGSGSGTVPTAAELFPAFTAPGPFQPIVLTDIMQIGEAPPPYTQGTQPILIMERPDNVDVPAVLVNGSVVASAAVGATLDVTTGNWTNTPDSYHYQWLADGTPIAGANTNNYLAVSGDVGKSISCMVAAGNLAGFGAAAPSNAVTITATREAEEPSSAPNGNFSKKEKSDRRRK